jgi:hypothetical protein
MPLKPPQLGRKSTKPKSYAAPHKGDRWDDRHYVKCYLLARQGMTDTQIAGALHVDKITFYKWRDSNPALQDALAQARTEEAGAGSFSEYVHGRLPEHLRPIWTEIMEIDQCKDESVYARRQRLEKMLEGKGRRVQQHLWLHALVNSNFNKFEACRKTGISRGTVQNWVKDDVNFMELVEQVVEMKKDFVEGCLFGLIGQGDAAATIFASRTLNRDRGYDPKITVVHKGKVKLAGGLDLNKVIGQLPLKMKRAFLDAIREAKNGDTPRQLPPRVVTSNSSNSSNSEDSDDE